MLAWLKDLDPMERRTMAACFGGWSLDALDVQMADKIWTAVMLGNNEGKAIPTNRYSRLTLEEIASSTQ